MKDDMDVPCILSNVVPNQSLTFSGSKFGLVKFQGDIILSRTMSSSSKTKIDYNFELSGCLGSFLALLTKKDVIDGTEGGLKNLKEFSEEAQKKE